MTNDIRQQAGTPDGIFKTLHEEYSFEVDLCAVAYNAKLGFYLSPENDALSFDWRGIRGWCNPPFNNIPPWLSKARELAFGAVMLPVRSDRLWWMQYKPLAECHYFVGEKPHHRIRYIPPPGVKYSSNSGCDCLFLFGEGATPGLEVYRSGRTGERL